MATIDWSSDQKEVMADVGYERSKPVQRKIDMVESPPHYNQSDEVECIDAIKAALGEHFIYYLTGTALKYLWRWDAKAKPEEDLRKARWYINKAIEEAGDKP